MMCVTERDVYRHASVCLCMCVCVCVYVWVGSSLKLRVHMRIEIHHLRLEYDTASERHRNLHSPPATSKHSPHIFTHLSCPHIFKLHAHIFIEISCLHLEYDHCVSHVRIRSLWNQSSPPRIRTCETQWSIDDTDHWVARAKHSDLYRLWVGYNY